jgi:hypothetical protein
MNTTTRIRVRVEDTAEGWVLRDVDTGQRRAIEGSREAAEIKAADAAWYVVNRRPQEEAA